MNLALVLAFLFFMGSIFGWFLELLFRKFFSPSNPEHKWVNPGFLVGPYVPLYGTGLVLLFLLAMLEEKMPGTPAVQRLLVFLLMAAAMTLIEYITGLACIRIMKVRLWDYSRRPGNIQGIICPLFSFFWALLGAAYYFLIHGRVLRALAWLSRNLAFSFFIGLFFGVFLIDLVHSTNLLARLRKAAEEKQMVVHYEELKERVRLNLTQRRKKAGFFLSMHFEEHLREAMKDYNGHLRRPGSGKKARDRDHSAH